MFTAALLSHHNDTEVRVLRHFVVMSTGQVNNVTPMSTSSGWDFCVQSGCEETNGEVVLLAVKLAELGLLQRQTTVSSTDLEKTFHGFFVHPKQIVRPHLRF